jgi:hypothetical protein
MKREHIGNFVAIVVALAILLAAWIVNSPGFWGGLFGMIVGPIFAVLFIKWMKKFQDERFSQIYLLSTRNSFVFLLFALPFSVSFLAINLITAEFLAALIMIVWGIALAIAYASGIYYYKKW